MKKGLITKVLFKGQKVYAVITEFDDTNVMVRFPFSGVSGTVEIIEIIVPKADCRKPMQLGACPSNAKSAVMATSACGSPKWESQDLAT